MTALSDLLRPFDPDRFRDLHWGKIPASWETSATCFEHLRQLVSFEKLPELVHRASNLSVWFRSRDGTLQTIVTSPDNCLALHQAGMTLYGQLKPERFPELAPVFDAGRVAAEELGLAPGSFNLSFFASARGGQTPPHFDNGDGLTMHLHGAKRWALAPNQHVAWPTRNHVMGKTAHEDLQAMCVGPLPVAMPEGATEYSLKPGTMLYIPRGTWHTTWTDEDSLALDFNFTSVTLWKDVISPAIDRLLLSIPEARQAASPRSSGLLDRILNELRARLAHLEGQALLPPQGPRPAGTAVRWNVLATAHVERIEQGKARVIFQVSGLHEHGLEVRLPVVWLPLLEELKGGLVAEESGLEERGIPPQQARSVLDALWEGGVVLPARPASATP
jgi:50S ribosomal protein L16 3-hydroxylase